MSSLRTLLSDLHLTIAIAPWSLRVPREKSSTSSWPTIGALATSWAVVSASASLRSPRYFNFGKGSSKNRLQVFCRYIATVSRIPQPEFQMFEFRQAGRAQFANHGTGQSARLNDQFSQPVMLRATQAQSVAATDPQLDELGKGGEQRSDVRLVDPRYLGLLVGDFAKEQGAELWQSLAGGHERFDDRRRVVSLTSPTPVADNQRGQFADRGLLQQGAKEIRELLALLMSLPIYADPIGSFTRQSRPTWGS